MSYKRRSDYKAPRERHEIWVAVLAAVLVIAITAALVWFLRPNRGSSSSTTSTTAVTPTTAAGATTTTPATTAPPSTAASTP